MPTRSTTWLKFMNNIFGFNRRPATIYFIDTDDRLIESDDFYRYKLKVMYSLLNIL